MYRITYATLSHCWGNALTTKLLKSLVDDFSVEIPWLTLCQTFKDAVITTLKLGIRYLWIDALCIIQDDKDDWNKEGPRMVGVYSNSYINIAADASKDGTEGLFRQRVPPEHRSFVIPHQKSANGACASIFYVESFDYANCSRLADRAWVVQERFLAPRVLHFTNQEIFWDCAYTVSAESGLIPEVTRGESYYGPSEGDLHIDKPKELRIPAAYFMWSKLVYEYTRASLTYPSDRPMAIAGLARIFCDLLELPHTAYICGMWQPLLQHNLLWRNEEGGTWLVLPERGRIANIPSWSWLSLCTPIIIAPPYFDDLDHLSTADVVRIDVDTDSNLDSFGSIVCEKVTMRAPLCRVTICDGGDLTNDHQEPISCVIDLQNGEKLLDKLHFQVYPDYPLEKEKHCVFNTPVFLMLIRATTCDEVRITGEPRECTLWYEPFNPLRI